MSGIATSVGITAITATVELGGVAASVGITAITATVELGGVAASVGLAIGSWAVRRHTKFV
jgi:hypothetical protein